ncbi:hypothetical protein [Candidatus Endomicrobiellum devescovinae]|jgi:hypothetical protein|uniref:CC0125/CC1285 family lipoprotein n=1 Tax=Candidatus Endomicrobiellum devescovinae TaxID=3242322 RepID=UPI002826D55A|nr:hypothetical protein [Endomicrobium sp.]
MKKLVILYIVSFLSFQGCATIYQPEGITGGFSETQLDENKFRVKFSGNGYTSNERARNFCWLRCAELTQENGYNYFSILNENSDIKKSSYRTPVNAYTNYYGNHSYTTVYGGHTYRTYKPRWECLIELYHNQDINNLFNAEFVIMSLSQKYGLENFFRKKNLKR